MPFASQAQRNYLFKFKPKLAKEWAHRYGTEVHKGKRRRKR